MLPPGPAEAPGAVAAVAVPCASLPAHHGDTGTGRAGWLPLPGLAGLAGAGGEGKINSGHQSGGCVLEIFRQFLLELLL